MEGTGAQIERERHPATSHSSGKLGTRPPSEAMSRSDESSLALSRNKRLLDTKQVRDEEKSTKDEKTDSTNPLPHLHPFSPGSCLPTRLQTHSLKSYPSLKGI